MPRNQGTSRKGKPKKNERAVGMGRALQKAQPHKYRPKASVGGMAMTPGVESINVNKEEVRASVLDMSDLDDFLIQAEMANREFASERQQVVILDSKAQAAESQESTKTIKWADEPVKNPFAFQELSVPRRPNWDESTTPEELEKREKESFLDWRRAIALREEEIILKSHNPLGVTPFEKNLEIWRQLWRVMERSSCIVQIVDARNPLFYLSKDLKRYATDELGKPMVLLVNKSDYLTPAQRKEWHDYFSQPQNQWDHVFFSAFDQQLKLDKEAAEARETLRNNVVLADEFGEEEEEEEPENEIDATEPEELTQSSPMQALNQPLDLRDVGVEEPLSRMQLLDWLHAFALEHRCAPDLHHNRIAFGMVGFPNVGKSSVINVLMGNARNDHGVVRVAVASQPGKTKHFQTLLLPKRDDMMLCDCPGLVFPSFVNNTADLIAAGVYPISQMRDHWPVVSLLCHRIPREVLNAHYGIQIPLPSSDAMMEAKDGEIPDPTADEFLSTYCVARGLLAASSGVPDYARASRIVIKDYADGKLLYCHAPPTSMDVNSFQKETLTTMLRHTKKLREKLSHNLLVSPDSDDAESPAADENELPLEDDEMLTELLDSTTLTPPKSENSSTPARKKRWGKKGRKLRNKDPYGCHAMPDEMLADAGASKFPSGVSVNAGKYSRDGYTRPAGYGTQLSSK